MEEKNYTRTIPAQEEGGVINAESVQEMPDESAAAKVFQTAKARLLDINNWNSIATRILSKFQLTDQAGNEITGYARQGNYIQINIAGPGTEAGNGYDWVYLELIENYTGDHVESIGIRVRPTANPSGNNRDIAHFYTDEATSTFTITREYSKVTAAIYDRNIKINVSSDDFLERARNAVYGAAGKSVFSKIQWEYLAHAWIEA